mmetsp:Transcript_133772/g.250285  ORF Transcript_133772/g.250285 Transcript_133772/m.250285 type:complete len:152 (+) Transcript_133772:82-537(+)
MNATSLLLFCLACLGQGHQERPSVPEASSEALANMLMAFNPSLPHGATKAGNPRRVSAITMAHKKGAGSTKNGRDSNPKYLGMKVSGGTYVKTGMIILKQRGLKKKAGLYVGVGRDHTLFALKPGIVTFSDNSTTVNVLPQEGHNLIKKSR